MDSGRQVHGEDNDLRILLSSMMLRVASIPLSSGMVISIITTSGLQLGGQAHSLPAIGGFPDQDHIRLGFQHHPQAFTDHGMIVGEYNTNRHALAVTSIIGHRHVAYRLRATTGATSMIRTFESMR